MKQNSQKKKGKKRKKSRLSKIKNLRLKVLIGVALLALLSIICLVPQIIIWFFGGIGIILLTIVILLVLPVKAEVWYNNQLDAKNSLEVKFSCLLFYRKKLYPFAPKKKSVKKKEETKPEPKTSQEIEEKKTAIAFDDVISYLSAAKKVVPTLGWFVRRLLRRIKIWDFDMAYGVSAEDAGDCGIKYGQTCILVMPLLAVVAELFNMQYRYIDIFPDFNHKSIDENGESLADKFYLHFKVTIIPLSVIVLALLFGKKLVPHIKEFWGILNSSNNKKEPVEVK